MRSPHSNLFFQSVQQSIAQGLKARAQAQGWEHQTVGFLSFDEQGQILADSLLATGGACVHLSPGAALKAALTEDTHTILLWLFQATPSSSGEEAFREFTHTLHFGCIEFGIRLRVLPTIFGTP